MEVQGKLIVKLEETTGEGANGTWTKGGFVIRQQNNILKKIAFTLFNDKVDLIKNLPIGTEIKVSFSAESREHNGRWYTELKCFSIQALQVIQPQSIPYSQAYAHTPQQSIPQPDNSNPFDNNRGFNF